MEKITDIDAGYYWVRAGRPEFIVGYHSGDPSDSFPWELFGSDSCFGWEDITECGPRIPDYNKPQKEEPANPREVLSTGCLQDLLEPWGCWRPLVVEITDTALRGPDAVVARATLGHLHVEATRGESGNLDGPLILRIDGDWEERQADV